MRLLQLFLVWMGLLFWSNFSAQQFPVTFTTDSLSAAKNNLDKWDGKLIAAQCVVKQIEKGYYSKPFYKCHLSDEGFIWIGSLMDDFKRIQIDDTVRVLGYISKVEKSDSISKKYNALNFQLLAFGLLNLTQQKAYNAPGVDTQFNEWKAGIINQEKQ